MRGIFKVIYFIKSTNPYQKGNHAMSFHAKEFAGSHCGCRYQQDYRPTLGRDGKKESGTLEVIKFYYDGAIRFEQHCYGEAATFVFGVWASGMVVTTLPFLSLPCVIIIAFPADPK